MTKRKVVLVATAVLGMALLTGFGWGRHHGAFDKERAQKWADFAVDDFLDELDATDAQRAKIHQLKEGLVPAALALHAENQGLKREALAQWDAKTPDAAKVHAMVDGRIAAFGALAHKITDAALTLHATLTPEQRKELSVRAHEHLDSK